MGVVGGRGGRAVAPSELVATPAVAVDVDQSRCQPDVTASTGLDGDDATRPPARIVPLTEHQRHRVVGPDGDAADPHLVGTGHVRS